MNPQRFLHGLTLLLAQLLATFILAACGGGGGSGTTPTSNATTAPATSTTAVTATTTTTTTTLPPIGSTLTTLQLASTGNASQSNVPVTFGQIFSRGDLPAGAGLTGVIGGGLQIPLQVNVKASHSDGSIRHAVVSAIVPQLNAGQTQTLALASTSTSPNTSGSTPAALLAAGFTASASLDINGQVYTASADTLLAGGTYTTWLSGPLVTEWLVSAPLKTAGGIEHPHLNARFSIRHYAGASKARIDITIENNWAYEPDPKNITYAAQVFVGGQKVYENAALTHYHHARWRKVFWWSGAAPEIHIKHDSAYLIASRAVPNYDPGITISTTALNALLANWNGKNTGPMGSGVVLPYMPTTGGRPDIGPLPMWAAMHVISMDARAAHVTLGVGDLAGSWPIHYRDKATGLPVSIVDYPYSRTYNISSDSYNPVTKKNESLPVCTATGACTTPYSPDTAHQPSMAYVPYLLTGDFYYLEELHFWANWNLITGHPYYRAFSKGLVRNEQLRGQAWSLRTLGHAAYITPDAHPMKQYFTQVVGHNLDFYNQTYVTGNPNQLGAIDGTGQYAFNAFAYSTPAGASTGIAPWQDDFFTWSIGYLAELDFSAAQPILAWKAKFPVGRMTAPGYCWIDGASYTLTLRPSSGAALYTSFAQVYQSSMRAADGSVLVNSKGARYLDQACGSQAQADWRTQYDKDTNTPRMPWVAGEMTGYATYAAGMPSNMQPALAVAADAGIPDAQNAWNIFINRPVKPDYSTEPQWAIVPR